MKTKGISFWEQHIEHFVLGGALVFLLAFIAWQAISDPNKVEQGNRTVGPGEIDELLVAKAEEVRGRLSDDAAPGVEIPDHEPMEERLAELLDASVSGRPRLVALAPEADFGEDFGASTDEDVTYAVPEPPAPVTIIARQDFDALADGVLDDYPDLQELFPAEPYDVSFVTVAAMLPLDSARDAYANPGGDGDRVIPTNWYGGRINVLDVRLEREEYVDGTWSNQMTLDNPPGFESLRETIAAGLDSRERDEILEQLGMGGQRAILQPAFYPLKLDTWSEPDPRDEAAGMIDESMTKEQQLIASKRRELGKQQKLRQKKIATAKADGCSIDENRGLRPRDESADEDRKPGRDRPGRDGGGTTGRRGGGGGGAPPGTGGLDRTGGSGSGRSLEEMQRKCDKLQRAVTGINEKIRGLQADLEELTGELVDDEGDVTEETMDGEEIRIWAFDIQAEAGHTYRYRFVVDYYNPFFGRRLNLVEDQDALAETVFLRAEPSAWTAPITAILPMKVFVTKAYGSDSRKAGRLGMGMATAEVYRFYGGRWWMQDFQVQPGDRVGAVEEVDGGDEIDYGSDWFVLDILDVVDPANDDQSATVTLQNLRDESMIVVHDPAIDLDDSERDELRDKIREAEAAVAGLAADG